jgi:MtN3 and saliva related transmembrane protein
MTWTLIGAIAAVSTMFGFVPQIIKILRTRSASDVSLATVVQFIIGVSFWLAYGIHLRDVIIIGANAVTCVTLLVLLRLYFRYR